MKHVIHMLIAAALSLSVHARAAEHYVIDTQGMHAFITFKIQHLGFSWLQGRFNRFNGEFVYDKDNPKNNRVTVKIDMTSLDTNHAERDKHLKSERFFDVAQYPTAQFVSTGWDDYGDGTATLKGRLTLRGVTKDVALEVKEIGAGKDPWGGFRRGFEGSTTLHLSDYRMKEAHILGPVAEDVHIWVSIEGVRQ